MRSTSEKQGNKSRPIDFHWQRTTSDIRFNSFVSFNVTWNVRSSSFQYSRREEQDQRYIASIADCHSRRIFTEETTTALQRTSVGRRDFLEIKEKMFVFNWSIRNELNIRFHSANRKISLECASLVSSLEIKTSRENKQSTDLINNKLCKWFDSHRFEYSAMIDVTDSAFISMFSVDIR